MFQTDVLPLERNIELQNRIIELYHSQPDKLPTMRMCRYINNNTFGTSIMEIKRFIGDYIRKTYNYYGDLYANFTLNDYDEYYKKLSKSKY